MLSSSTSGTVGFNAPHCMMLIDVDGIEFVQTRSQNHVKFRFRDVDPPFSEPPAGIRPFNRRANFSRFGMSFALMFKATARTLQLMSNPTALAR